MGLIKALTNAVSTAVGDQFKEYVTCPAVGNNDVLIVRGVIHHGEGNTNPSENVISNGTRIAIPQGWAMMLVDNGKVEFSSEAGEYTYDNSSEPSIFYGGLGQGVVNTFKTIGQRFTFGGQTARDQRVYYINLLNVLGNTFGSGTPKDIYDETYGMSIKMQYHGTFAYQIVDPIVLVGTVIGANPKDKVTFEEVFGKQFKGEISEEMYKALSFTMAEKKCRYSQIGLYVQDISNQLNAILGAKWGSQFGVMITEVSMEHLGPTDEYAELVKKHEAEAFGKRINAEAEAYQTKVVGQEYSNNMAGTMAAATAEAMKNAASNENGTLVGLAGLNMTQSVGNTVMGAVAGMGGTVPTQNAPVANVSVPGTEATPGVAPEAAVAAGVEQTNSAVPNFCPSCGTKTNGANFCSNCGNKLV